MVQLTVAVPAYNAERYIRKCLDCMAGADARLELIVVDDGSTDGTAAIVKAYAERYPGEVSLISKQNGGHGSVINTAIKMAKGRYFKVIDADDWIIKENLSKVLDELEKTEADVVFTGYHTVDKKGEVRGYLPQCQYTNQEIDIGRFMEAYNNIYECCSFWGVIYRTDFYQGTKIELSENVFYDDQEYVTLPFAYVNSILILPLYFYQYKIGDNSQSTSSCNQVKYIDHIEHVIRRLLAYREAIPMPSIDREEYFRKRLAWIAVSYLTVALVKDHDRMRGYARAEHFYEEMKITAPDIASGIKKKYYALLALHHFHISAGWYQKFLDTGLYKKIRTCFIMRT